MFSHAVRLFDIAGFQIRVDPSWLLIAGLIVWTLSTAWFPVEVPGLAQSTYVIASTLAMLGLFGGLILHELSHSLVARRYGINVGAITLFIFGGVAELDEEPQSAGSEFWIAIAGPVMSFAVAAVVWVLAGVLQAAGPLIVAVLGYIAVINFILGLFNLIPAFPLDGGRILRAALWHKWGDVVRATRIASMAGGAFGYALIALGLYALFAGGMVGGLWQVLIGVFVIGASRTTYQQVLFRAALKGQPVAAVMSREVRTIDPDETLADTVDHVMLRHGISFLPVTGVDGHLFGHIDIATIRGYPREDWPGLTVRQVMIPASGETTVRPDMSSRQLMELISKSGRRKFLVASGGALEGVVSLSDLMGHIEVSQSLGAAPRR